MPNVEAFLINSDPKQIAFRPLLREFNTSSTQAFLEMKMVQHSGACP